MTGLLMIAIIAVGAGFYALFRRVGTLEQLVGDLQDRVIRIDPGLHPADREIRQPQPTARQEAMVVRTAPRATPPPATISAPRVGPVIAAPQPPPPPPLQQLSAPEPQPARLGFEQIVGGKLPIWIGGAALVLAAFFLVRFSIENGLLGPMARTIIATLFGIALIAASEAARRLRQTRDDPRIAQALAGAGIASLYGTLYIAASLYGLIGALAAFALMIAVTVAALALALRHGPPTAIMALIGGFSAPLIAGFESAGIGPLLAYLGLLVAALFGLAIRRGWVWLALAACGGGFAWVNLLAATIDGRDLAGVGGFVLLLAIGATLALPRTGTTRKWLRLLPLLAGFVQLLILAPALDFGPFAWGLYLVLSAAALWLGWRDAALAPGAGAALAFVLLLLGVSLTQESGTARYAAVGVTLLFGIPGHLRAGKDWFWAGIALAASGGPVLLAVALAHGLLAPAGWAALLTLAAIAAASLSRRDSRAAMPGRHAVPALTGGAALAALLAAVALRELLPLPWLWPAWLAIGVALAVWAKRSGDGGIALLAVVSAPVTALAVLTGIGTLRTYTDSVFSAGPLPPLADLIAIGLLPPSLLAATAWLLPRDKPKHALNWAAYLLALALVPAILPAPWHAAGLGLATLAAIAARLPSDKLIAAGSASAVAALPAALDLLHLLAASVAGDRLPYLLLPPLLTVLREIALPGALIGAGLTRRRDAFGPARASVVALVALTAAAGAYALAKAPLAIGTPARLAALGFLERATLTQGVLLAAYLLRARLPRIAFGLLALGLARFAWFDLLILNPVIVAQSVGTIPILNLAVAHAALIVVWLWPRRHAPWWRSAMLATIFLAVAVAVRQATHGAVLTGPIGRTENWLYSAAFLGLALVWLTRGILKPIGDLRTAGLVLLTIVTLKVFLIDASALEGILRIVSFLGLGLALMAIGWAYNRFVTKVTVTSV